MGWEQGHVWWDPPTLHWSQKRRCSLGNQILTAKDEAMCYTCEVELHLQRISTLLLSEKQVELEFDSTSTQFHLISCQFLQLNWVGLGLENATSLVMSKSSNHMVKPCLQVAKDLSAGEQMHLLISPILCACFWSCVCPIITLEQHPNETAARKRKKSHYCMPLSSLSRMCHCSSLDALFTKQAARSMLTKRRVGSNLKGSLNWQVTETE